MTEHKKQNTKKFEVKDISKSANRFSEKLNELKEFSENLPAQSELPSVPQTGGLFGWFSYDVKGSDLNKLTQSIQDKMIAQNQVLVRTIQEFHKIYETFTLLDKEYIYAILNSMEASEEANRKALQGLIAIEEHQAIIKQNQDDIQDIIDQQLIVIQALKKHKEKLDKLKHLESIDKIHSDLSKMKIHFQEFITKHDHQNDELNESINLIKSIQSEHHSSLLLIKKQLENEAKNLRREVLIQTEILKTLKLSNKEHDTNIVKLQLNHETLQNKINKIQEEISMSFNSINIELSDAVLILDKSISENKALIGEVDEKVKNQIQNLVSGVEREKNSISSYINSKLLNHQQINENQNIRIEKLTKELKITKIFSYMGMLIVFVLTILIISGVL